MLEIHLLGGLLLAQDGEPLPRPGSTLLPALLARLVLQPGVPFPRARLAPRFWPDSSDVQARTNLRGLVLELRKALPEPARFVITDGPDLVWRADAPFTVDVASFERLAKEARSAEELDRAVDAYTGDLLPECRDRWVVAERQRLRAVFSELLERAIAEREAAGDLAKALAYAQRLRQHTPLSEPVYCHLIRLHARLGDRAAAERVYAACVRLLRQEAAIAPSLATRELIERVRTGEFAPSATTPPHTAPQPIDETRRPNQTMIEATTEPPASPIESVPLPHAPPLSEPGRPAARQSRLRRALPALPIALLLGLAALASFQWWQAPAEALPTGSYSVTLQPTAAAAAAGAFIALHGTTDGLPRRVRLWTVIGYQGYFWPQEAAFRSGDTWAGVARIGGGSADRGKDLDLLAVLADRAADDDFGAWLRQGYRTGQYPPLSALPAGSRIVAAMRVHVQ